MKFNKIILQYGWVHDEIEGVFPASFGLNEIDVIHSVFLQWFQNEKDEEKKCVVVVSSVFFTTFSGLQLSILQNKVNHLFTSYTYVCIRWALGSYVY